MIVCHVIIFVVVVRQHVKIRMLVTTTDADSIPNPVLLPAKSAKKILTVTVTYIILTSAGFTGVYVKNTQVQFFAMWISYSQGIWSPVFFVLFSRHALTLAELKKFCCKQGSTQNEDTNT